VGFDGCGDCCFCDHYVQREGHVDGDCYCTVLLHVDDNRHCDNLLDCHIAHHALSYCYYYHAHSDPDFSPF